MTMEIISDMKLDGFKRFWGFYGNTSYLQLPLDYFVTATKLHLNESNLHA